MDSHYQSYLLRFQRGQTQAHWRATLENVHTRERLHFATEREMLLYLMKVLKIESPAAFNQVKTPEANIANT